MKNGWVGLGVLVICAMGIMPPMQMTVYDPYGKKGDRLFGDTTRTETYTATHLVYRPVWRETPDEVAAGLKVKSVRVAWTWLGVQVLGIGLVVGGLMVLRRTGTTAEVETKEAPPAKSSSADSAD